MITHHQTADHACSVSINVPSYTQPGYTWDNLIENYNRTVSFNYTATFYNNSIPPVPACSAGTNTYTNIYFERTRAVTCAPGQGTDGLSYCAIPTNTPIGDKNMGGNSGGGGGGSGGGGGDSPGNCGGSGGGSGGGGPGSSNFTGNPINAGFANKFQVEVDYVGLGAFPLNFTRSYNSGANATAGISPAWRTGFAWRHSYERQIDFVRLTGLDTAYVYRPDGKAFYFRLQNGNFVVDADISARLLRFTDASANTTGWQFTNGANDAIELYDATGKLQSITTKDGLVQTLNYSDATTPASIAPDVGFLIRISDSFGRQLNLTYNNGRIGVLTDAAGGVYSYGYDSAGNLTSVVYPDGKTRTYLYNEAAYTSGASLPRALTGITDENGVRFATWNYDAAGRATSSEHAGGAEKVTLSYDSSSQTTVSDYKDSASTINVSRVYNFQTVLGVVKATGMSQPCSSGCGNSSAATTYDANGNASSRTDFNGNKTTFAYDLARNLETQRVEGLTSAGAATPSTRTLSSEWHPTWRVIKRMAEPKRITSVVSRK